MSIQAFFKKLGGRAGNKTRSKGKVNTRRNKRASNKAIRGCLSAEEIAANEAGKKAFLDEYTQKQVRKQAQFYKDHLPNLESQPKGVKTCDDPPHTCEPPWCDFCNGLEEYQQTGDKP